MKENKKKLGVIVISLILMIGLVIGLTYAAFNYTSSGAQENIVSTTAVTMKYTEKTNGITLENAMPIDDETGKSLALDSNYAFYFTISIVTGSATPVGFEVTAEKLTAKELFDKNLTDEDKEADVKLVKDDEVRLYLERSENNPDNYQSIMEPTIYTPLTESTPLGAQVGEMMLDFGTVSETKTYHYILRMWLGENYEVDNVERYYGVRVNVYGTDSRSYSNTLTLNKNNIEFEIGESEELTPTVTPENVTNADITWSSSDSTIATIDTMGNVTGVSPGTATITATTSKGRKATCTVKVNSKSPKSISGIEVGDSTLNDLDLTLTIEEEKVVGVNISPNDYDSSIYNITWTTTDSDIVDIEEVTDNATGTSSNNETIIASKMASKNITAKKVKLVAGSTPGEATITASIQDKNGIVKDKDGNNLTKSFKVIVKNPYLESITLDTTNATLERNGDTLQLNATLNPVDASNSDLTWESSNPSVASVSNSGLVTPLSKGKTTITVSGTTGTSATATINVINELSSSLSFDVNQSLNVGQKHTYNAVVTPSDARDVDYITWTSSDPTIASIPESCNTNHTTSCEIEALKKGTTTITIETKDVENGNAIRTETSTLIVSEVNLNDKIASFLTTSVNEVGGITRKSTDGTIIETKNNVTWPSSATHTNYRYTSNGDNPVNNYVNFNCDLDGTNCEKWRIIGSFSDIYSTGTASGPSGTKERRVKIMRATSIGGYSWDTYDNGDTAASKWEEGDLMHLLNGGFTTTYKGQLSTLTNNSLYWDNEDGTCFNGQNNSTTECNFKTRTDGVHGLKTDTTKNMIGETYWNLGGHGEFSIVLKTNNFLQNTVYGAERGNTPGGAKGALFWIGKVALIYSSDYAYAGWNCTQNYMFYQSNGTDVSQCNNSNWMYNGGAVEWLLSPTSISGHIAWFLFNNGSVYPWTNIYLGLAVRPSVYLKSNVVVKEDGQDGSYDKPYNIELGS